MLTKMYIRLVWVPVYGKTKYLFSKITLQTETKEHGNVQRLKTIVKEEPIGKHA